MEESLKGFFVSAGELDRDVVYWDIFCRAGWLISSRPRRFCIDSQGICVYMI